jgi:hypothetical protein
MARPSLRDSLMAALTKGTHIETAEKIARGLPPIPEDGAPSPTLPDESTKIPDIVSAQTPDHNKEQTSGQATEQASKGANTQATDRASIRAVKQASKGADNRAGEQATNPSLQQLSKHSSNQATGRAFGQATEQASEQPLPHPLEQAPEHLKEQAPKQPTALTGRYAWLPLNANQGRILLFLYEQGNGLTNMDIVVAETGIAYGTARKAIDVLVSEGYIISKSQHNGHAFRGFEYTLNNHLCSLYVSRIKEEQPDGQPSWQSFSQPNKQPSGQATGQANKQTTVSFSSSRINNPTTTEYPLGDPELGYWKAKGLTSRQVEKWAEEFSMDVELVLQSLKHCRYEMVVLNLEEEKNIENAMNWFYKVMQRSGFYARPKEYKSMAEIRAEEMERAARDMVEARERQAAAEFELEFQRMIDDPGSDDYQQLFDQLTDFEKQSTGKVLEMGLKRVFQASKEP